MVPSLDEGAGGRGIHGAHSHEVWGDGVGCERHRNKRSGVSQKRERGEEVTRTKNGAKKKNQNFLCVLKSATLGLKLGALSDGLRGRPLDHRRGLIRSTWPSTHQQRTYVAYVRKIVLVIVTLFLVVQIVLLYYCQNLGTSS